MNVDDVRKALAAIEENKQDFETAHSDEDALLWRFVAHVAESGSPELAEMAREVLKSKDIEFDRWCA